MIHAYDPDHPIQLTSSQIDHIVGSNTLYVQNLLWAAQIGADMQLERCREWLMEEEFLPRIIADFMNTMRPRPLSKRVQAIGAIEEFKEGLKENTLYHRGSKIDLNLLLEGLMEGQGDG